MKTLRLQLFLIIGVLELANGADLLSTVLDLLNEKNNTTGNLNKDDINVNMETTTLSTTALKTTLSGNLLKQTEQNKYLNNLEKLTPNQLLALRNRLLSRLKDVNNIENETILLNQLDVLNQWIEKLEKEQGLNMNELQPDDSVTDLPIDYESNELETKQKIKERSPETINKYRELVQKMTLIQKRELRESLIQKLKILDDPDEKKSVQQLIDMIKIEEKKHQAQIRSTLKPLTQGNTKGANKAGQIAKDKKIRYLENSSKIIGADEGDLIDDNDLVGMSTTSKPKTSKRDVSPQLEQLSNETVEQDTEQDTETLSSSQKPTSKIKTTKLPDKNNSKNTSSSKILTIKPNELKDETDNHDNSSNSSPDEVPVKMHAPEDPLGQGGGFEGGSGFSSSSSGGGGGSEGGFSSGGGGSSSYSSSRMVSSSRRVYGSSGGSSGTMSSDDIIASITNPKISESEFNTLNNQLDLPGIPGFKQQVVTRFSQEISSGKWTGEDQQTLIRRKTIVEGPEAETEPSADSSDISDLTPEIFNMGTMEFRYKTLLKSLTKTQRTKVVKQWTRLSNTANSMEERETIERRKNMAMQDGNSEGGTTEEAETEPEKEGTEITGSVAEKKVQKMKILKKKKETETIDKMKNVKKNTKGSSSEGEAESSTKGTASSKANEGESKETTMAPTQANTVTKKSNEGEDQEKTTITSNIGKVTPKVSEGEDREKDDPLKLGKGVSTTINPNLLTTPSITNTPEDPEDPLKLGNGASKTPLTTPSLLTTTEEEPDDPLKLGNEKDSKNKKKKKGKLNKKNSNKRRNPRRNHRKRPKYGKRMRTLCNRGVFRSLSPRENGLRENGLRENEPRVIYIREPCPEVADNREPDIYLSMIDEPVAALKPQCTQFGLCGYQVNDRDYNSNIIR